MSNRLKESALNSSKEYTVKQREENIINNQMLIKMLQDNYLMNLQQNVMIK